MLIEKITSRQNERVKEVKRIREGRVDGVMFVEGVRLAEEAVRSGVKVREVFVTSRCLDTGRGATLLKTIAAPIFELSEKAYDSIGDTKNSQGVVFICDRPPQPDIDSFLRTDRLPLTVFMVEANNPSNVGAVVRVAEAAGAAGLVTSQNSADVYSPKALRASMGSAFRLPLIQGEDYADLIRRLRKQGMRITAAAGEGDLTHTGIDWRVPRLLVLGSEARGLSDIQMQLADETIRIPMETPVESLNLSVAAGIILFEARRQFYL